jgi:hypothetical protein
VTRPRRPHRPALGLLRVDLPGVHDLCPAGEVAVFDDQDQRAAQGDPPAEPTGDLDPVVLDPLPRAAAESVLAAGQPAVKLGAVEGQPGREALDDGG